MDENSVGEILRAPRKLAYIVIARLHGDRVTALELWSVSGDGTAFLARSQHSTHSLPTGAELSIFLSVAMDEVYGAVVTRVGLQNPLDL